MKTATHAAAELTTGLLSPVYQQIDPLQLGEAARAMSIGNEYGKRLNRVARNLRPRALERLVSGYPDHGFVIDRDEADSLFYRVRHATEDERELSNEIEELCDVELGRKAGFIGFLNEELQSQGQGVPTGGNDAANGNHSVEQNGRTEEPAAIAGTGIQAFDRRTGTYNGRDRDGS